MPKMTIDADGRLRCAEHPYLITHNTPWPTPNGSPGGFDEPARGYVIHTEVGYEHAVEIEFNDPHAQASAFCSIGVDGHVHQYGPVGHGWKAWTQVDGNPKWRGVEHEDLGDPRNRLTDAQIESSASVLEAMSAHDGFPLAPTDDPNGEGVIFHSDGGAAWGGHDCPGATRRRQRGAIVARAKRIRRGTAPPVPVPKNLVAALQLAVHVKPTGRWTKETEARLQAVRRHTHDRLEQRAVGTVVDGDWGPKSERAENVTIHRVQAALGVGQDGTWGPQTDRAFKRARTKFYLS